MCRFPNNSRWSVATRRLGVYQSTIATLVCLIGLSWSLASSQLCSAETRYDYDARRNTTASISPNAVQPLRHVLHRTAAPGYDSDGVGSLFCQIRKKALTCKRRGIKNITQKLQRKDSRPLSLPTPFSRPRKFSRSGTEFM